MELPVILALVAIVIFGIMGFRDGVIKRLLEIAGLIVTIIFTGRFAVQVAPWIMENTGTEEGPALLLAWAGMIFVGLIFSRILARIISKGVRLTILGWVDRLGGAVLGIAIGTLLSSVVLLAATQVPGGESVATSCNSSMLGSLIYHAAPDMYATARTMFGEEAEDALSRVMEEAQEKAEALGEKAKESVQEKVKEAVEDKVDL